MLLVGLVVVAGAIAAPAAGHVVHTVEPGESLSSIAAEDGLSVEALAAANGLSSDAQLIEGTNVSIPPQGGSSSSASSSSGTTSSSSSSSGSGAGSYVVQPGDTLSEIAARAGMSTSELAARNGLSVEGILVAGTALALSGGGGDVTESGGDEPVPTNESVTSDQIAETASSHGVPPDLASAIAWQESGFDNSLTSSANARGVMQIIPDTWNFVEDSIAGRDLDATSAAENVHAGVMYLGYLLRETGSEEVAAASYYQGLAGVRGNGTYPDTQRYVDNVTALRRRFTGP
jgi:N-acetylmuramoyl-L-alanine amidase